MACSEGLSALPEAIVDPVRVTVMKMLYGVSVLPLLCAGVLFTYSARQWGEDTSEGRSIPDFSAVDRFQTRHGHAGRDRRDTVAPIVAQAMEFALYLDPPKPPVPKVTATPRVAAPPPAPRPPVVAPKFRLLAISYYRGNPEKSLAMVSEPGKGSSWIGRGERVGHLVIESIAEQGIVYRDGSQSREMKVDVKSAASMAQLKSAQSASASRVTQVAGH
jgi:hypothetical protein